MLIEQRGGKRDSERQRQREVDRKIEREREREWNILRTDKQTNGYTEQIKVNK